VNDSREKIPIGELKAWVVGSSVLGVRGDSREKIPIGELKVNGAVPLKLSLPLEIQERKSQ